MSAGETLQGSIGARATFADLGVPGPMAKALRARGINEPFPIQAATLPDGLAGRDLCGRAPTGSGKTLAFGIPMVAGAHEAGRARPRRPRGLVLVPTRELAAQVCRELQLLAKPRGPWVEAFYGGTPYPRQVSALKRGVDIAVACPGRLSDLISQGHADLSDVQFVVLDEADRMADMGFLPEVKRLLDQCNDDRQTFLFSATLDGDVQVLIDRYLTDPARHELGPDEADLSRSTHHFWSVEPSHRVDTTADLVHQHGPTVVFCRTKRGADRVTRQLEQAGVRAVTIHGDRSQNQRDQALRAFDKGNAAALVATDVAARGIHVDGVACVVHFDPPADHKDYVHRSGRTARAGATGVVVSLVVPPMRGAVTRLQKALDLPTGLTQPDTQRRPAAARVESGPTPTRPAGGQPAERSRRPKPGRPAKSGKPGRPGSTTAGAGATTTGSARRSGGSKPTTAAKRGKRTFDSKTRTSTASGRPGARRRPSR